jgi:hypothetical protein
MSRPLSREAKLALQSMTDAWRMTPPCFTASATLEGLELSGLAETKRERHGVPSVYRVFIRRTAKGRAALGLET